MIRISSGAWRRLAGPAVAVACCAFLAACGSGAVTDNTASTTSGPLTITPSTATLYSELPTTFLITGGNGSYIVLSSNQAVVPVAQSVSGNTLIVVPADVSADTQVTLTLRDTSNSLPATATLTVKPRTISNTVTVTPSSSQSAACGSAICSGGDAEVKAVLSQAGVPLAGRQVRFDVVSGDARIITSPAGQPETLAVTGTTTTDNTGTARIRIRILANATSQTAILRITDVASGFVQTTSVTIAPSSNAPLNAQPSTIAFVGPDSSTCATGTQADVIVFGGHPPYSVSQPGAFSVSPTLVASSGARFTVSATGQCSSAVPIAVVDSNGATVSVNASNQPASISVTPPAFVVAPTSVALDTCLDSATVTLAGGLGPGSYFASSGIGGVTVSVNGSIGVITRTHPSTINTTPVNVAFSDGRSVQTVAVSIGVLGGAPGCS